METSQFHSTIDTVQFNATVETAEFDVTDSLFTAPLAVGNQLGARIVRRQIEPQEGEQVGELCRG